MCNKQMTRDNFDPVKVLFELREGTIGGIEVFRLLEEACHALHRQHVLIENARAVISNLSQDLGCNCS